MLLGDREASMGKRIADQPVRIEVDLPIMFVVAVRAHGAQRGKVERLHPYRQLSSPGAEETGREAGVGEAEFPSAAAHDGDTGPDQGRRQRRARRFGTQQGRHHGERLHATDRGGREVDARCDLLGADGKGGGSGPARENWEEIWYGLVRWEFWTARKW